MITENNIRAALKEALKNLDDNETCKIQIHLNPEDRNQYLGTLITKNRSGRYTYNLHPLIANEHVAIGEVQIGLFFRI